MARGWWMCGWLMLGAGCSNLEFTPPTPDGNNDDPSWDDPIDDPVDDTDQLAMRYRTNNYATVGSVTVADDGQTFVAGMYGMTCQLNASLSFLTDVDIEDGEDTVDDSDDDGGGTIVLVRGGSELDLVELVPGWYTTMQSWTVSGVSDAAFWDGGTVALRQSADDCLVDFLDEDWAAFAGVGTCGVLALDRFGKAWATADGQLVSVSGGTAPVSHIAADLVVVDDVLDQVYAADGSQLTALSTDGDTVWSVALPGTVTSLTTMGDEARVVVLVDADRVMIHDGATGARLMDEQLPSSASLIEGARSADVLAIARGYDGLHVFDIVAN